MTMNVCADGVRLFARRLFARCLFSALLAVASLAPAHAADAGAPLPIVGKTLLLGPGDLLKVSVFQNPELGLEIRVDGDGRVTYPFLGTIDAGGKTTAELEKVIAEGLAKNGLLKQAQVSVALSQYRSQQIAVLGYVNRPGNYTLDLAYTVTGALALAGGASPVAADSVVLSRIGRDGRTQNTELDLVQMFRPGSEQRGDLPLQAGDIVYVHRAPVLYVFGEVNRPGALRLEREMTVQQAVSASGGLTLRGTLRGTRITRRATDGATELVDVGPQTRLLSDDVIYVRESVF